MLLGDDEVVTARTEPPPDTRARMRGDFIEFARPNAMASLRDFVDLVQGVAARAVTRLRQHRPV